jgi:flavin reductase (DIM6/NTAB) family NADH-FMN oxidoreductase RutF
VTAALDSSLTFAAPRPRAEPAPARVASREFIDAMSRLASGVVLVTCQVGDRPWGMTVTSFASVSADPPTILVVVSGDAASARAIAATGRFGVSLLAHDQATIARFGSVPGAAKFLEPFVAPEGDGSPVVAGALAHLDCEVVEQVPAADHTVFFGRVREVHASPGGRPLVYFGRAYRALAPAAHTNAKRSTRCRSS